MGRNPDTLTVIKAYTHSIVIHSFLGYLYWIYMNYTTNLINTMSSSFLGVAILLLGTLIFFDVLNRVSPYNQIRRHPLNISGKIAFVISALFCLTIL